MREKVDSHQPFRHFRYPGATLRLETSTLSIREFPEVRYVNASNTQLMVYKGNMWCRSSERIGSASFVDLGVR